MTDPTSLIVALLHNIGPRWVSNDEALASLFHKASLRDPMTFGRFGAHPVYKDCPMLDETFSMLLLGGSVETGSQHPGCYRATESVLGEYGEKAFDDLYPQDRGAVMHLADEIRELSRRTR